MRRARRRLAGRLGATRPIAWISARGLHAIDLVVYRITRGRTTFSSVASGLPVVILTTTGARSGRRRTIPLLALRDGERMIVIASNFGRPKHPGWYHNLRAHPRATIVVDGVARDVEARELHGAERERCYELGIDTNPGWIAYRDRADRQIPVIALDPVPG
jgi:deazaflavin-dependent oxidoreductase (nitroreductase family)